MDGPCSEYAARYRMGYLCSWMSVERHREECALDSCVSLESRRTNRRFVYTLSSMYCAEFVSEVLSLAIEVASLEIFLFSPGIF